MMREDSMNAIDTLLNGFTTQYSDEKTFFGTSTWTTTFISQVDIYRLFFFIFNDL